jgi:hypothetical protein
MGSNEVTKTKYETEATVAAAQIAADSQDKTSSDAKETGLAQAAAELEWHLQESADNLEASLHRDETDLEIAKMEYDVKLEEAANDAMRISQVEMVNAQANLTSAENEGKEWEAKADKWELQYAPDTSSGISAYTYDVA